MNPTTPFAQRAAIANAVFIQIEWRLIKNSRGKVDSQPMIRCWATKKAGPGLDTINSASLGPQCPTRMPSTLNANPTGILIKEAIKPERKVFNPNMPNRVHARHQRLATSRSTCPSLGAPGPHRVERPLPRRAPLVQAHLRLVHPKYSCLHRREQGAIRVTNLDGDRDALPHALRHGAVGLELPPHTVQMR